MGTCSGKSNQPSLQRQQYSTYSQGPELRKLNLASGNKASYRDCKMNQIYETLHLVRQKTTMLPDIYIVKHKNSEQKRILRFYLETPIEEIKEMINILDKLNHPGIPKINEYFIHSDENWIFTIQDLYDGKSLCNQLKNKQQLNECKIQNIIQQLVEIVVHMHKHKIMHRNINPGSIYFQSPDSNEIILEDFDFAVEYQKGENIEGQIYLEDDHYKAPEISQIYNQSCDIWSIGMLTFYLLTGTYPQLNEDGGVQDLQKEFSTQLWQQISKEAQEFIEQTLKFKSNQRPTANQLLKSKWMIKCQRIQDDSYLPNLTQALCNINNFSRGNKLRQAVYKYLTANLMSKDEIKHLKQVFLSMDKTGDGTLSKQELKDGYKQIHVLVDDEDIDYLFSQLENNQNQIYFKDWLQIASKQEQIVSRQRLEEAFKLFDDNNDGKLSVDELKILFTDHNIIKDTTWTQLIQQFDKNNDGEISLEEFIQSMQQIQTKNINKKQNEINNQNNVFQQGFSKK